MSYHSDREMCPDCDAPFAVEADFGKSHPVGVVFCLARYNGSSGVPACQVRTIARLRGELDAAKADADLLRATMTRDPELIRIAWEKSKPLEMHYRQGIFCLLAAQCRDMLKSLDADNYVEMQMGDDIGMMTVTIRKLEGKSPHQLRREAEAKIDEAICVVNAAASCNAKLDLQVLFNDLRHALGVKPPPDYGDREPTP